MESLIRVKQVTDRTGLAPSTVWLWVKEKKFPQPIKLSPRVTVWKLSDIDQWINSKIENHQVQGVHNEKYILNS